MMDFGKKISPFICAELSLAKSAQLTGDQAREFMHLERAHVLGQASTYQHVRVHFLMLVWGLRWRSWVEIKGQFLRIIGAVTKTVFGLVPSGNTGGANVSPFKTLPIPSDLIAMIEQAKA